MGMGQQSRILPAAGNKHSIENTGHHIDMLMQQQLPFFDINGTFQSLMQLYYVGDNLHL